MLTYISNFKSSVPSAHGFSAADLITTVLRRKNVPRGVSLLCFGSRTWHVWRYLRRSSLCFSCGAHCSSHGQQTCSTPNWQSAGGHGASQ